VRGASVLAREVVVVGDLFSMYTPQM
jgi:hypothetical protein